MHGLSMMYLIPKTGKGSLFIPDPVPVFINYNDLNQSHPALQQRHPFLLFRMFLVVLLAQVHFQPRNNNITNRIFLENMETSCFIHVFIHSFGHFFTWLLLGSGVRASLSSLRERSSTHTSQVALLVPVWTVCCKYNFILTSPQINPNGGCSILQGWFCCCREIHLLPAHQIKIYTVKIKEAF